MNPINPSSRTLYVLMAAILQALPALADGYHTGWCQGVYNPHHNTSCTSGYPHLGGGNHGNTPDVHTTSGGGTKPVSTQGPTPQTVTVTADTNATVVDPQNNPGAIAQTGTGTTQLQSSPTAVIHRPRPQPVIGPPQTIVYNPPSTQTPTQTQPPQGPRFVDGPLMQDVVLPPTRTPTQTPQIQAVPPLASIQHLPVVTPQPPVLPPQTPISAQIQPPPQGPRFVDGPSMQPALALPPTRIPTQVPQVLAQPPLTVAVQGPTVLPPQPLVANVVPRPPVVTPQPQVPVTSTNPAIPLAQQQPVVTSTPQPLAQPTLPTTTTGGNPPQVAVPPGQTPRPPVITAQPQVPVTTANPAIPLAQQQSVVTSTPQPLAQPTLPTTSTGGNPPQVAVPTGQTPRPPVITAQPQVPVTTANPAIPLAQQQPVVTSTPQPLAQPTLPPTVVSSQPPVAIPPIKQPGGAQVQAQPPVNTVQRLPGAGQPPASTNIPTVVGQAVPNGATTGPGSGPSDRTNTTGTQVAQASAASTIPAGRAWIVSGVGRQPAHALPTRTDVSETPVPIHCVASGFGPRRERLPDGTWQIIGLHPTLRTTDTIVRNIPANHHRDAGCLIEVRRRLPES